MSKKRYIVIGMITIILIFSVKLFNDYRERNLDELIGYKHKDFHSFGFIKESEEVSETQPYEWFSEEKEPVNELMEFLSQYRVKKISEEEYNKRINSEEIFEFTINHSKKNPAIVRVQESRVHILVGNYYEVKNEQIDMEWIKKYKKRFREKYGE